MKCRSPDDAVEVVCRRLSLLYRLDQHGMLLESNEPGAPGEPAPLVHVALGEHAVVYGLRSGLPDAVAIHLAEALRSLRPLSELSDPAVAQRVWDSVRAPHVKPCYAAVVDGRAVSICHTVRVDGRHREAGVDTWQAYRRQGCGTAVVAAWAMEVIRAGDVPLYSTNWNNYESLGIAHRLGLEQVALDLEIQ